MLSDLCFCFSYHGYPIKFPNLISPRGVLWLELLALVLDKNNEIIANANFQFASIDLLGSIRRDFWKTSYNNSSSFSYPIHNRALVASGSRFNFSQGGAEQIPTILRIFGRGVPFGRGRGGERGGGGHGRKTINHSTRRAACWRRRDIGGRWGW